MRMDNAVYGDINEQNKKLLQSGMVVNAYCLEHLLQQLDEKYWVEVKDNHYYITNKDDLILELNKDYRVVCIQPLNKDYRLRETSEVLAQFLNVWDIATLVDDLFHFPTDLDDMGVITIKLDKAVGGQWVPSYITFDLVHNEIDIDINPITFINNGEDIAKVVEFFEGLWLAVEQDRLG